MVRADKKNLRKPLTGVSVAGHNVGAVGSERTIFNLPRGDFHRALGGLNFKQRVAMIAKYYGASDEDIGPSFSKSRDGGQKFIRESLARVFELCDQIQAERERSAEDDG